MAQQPPHGQPPMQPNPLQQIAHAVGQLLVSGEQIHAIGMQDPKAPTIKKDAIVATDKRLIVYRPQMIGQFNFIDYYWHDVYDVHIKQGILFTDMTIRRLSGQVETIQQLNKEQARELYTVCQHYEHHWHELRRQRQMEEDRARAGGVTVNSPVVVPWSQQQPSGASQTSPPERVIDAGRTMQHIPARSGAQTPEDPVVKLGQLKAMLDQGLISQADYDEVKRDVLAKMRQ